MDIERDADDDLDFERLPSGAVVTGRDAKYLRNLRERATLNRPDELESDPVAAEPSIERLLDDLNDLHEQRAELIDLLQSARRGTGTCKSRSPTCSGRRKRNIGSTRVKSRSCWTRSISQTRTPCARQPRI